MTTETTTITDQDPIWLACAEEVNRNLGAYNAHVYDDFLHAVDQLYYARVRSLEQRSRRGYGSGEGCRR